MYGGLELSGGQAFGNGSHDLGPDKKLAILLTSQLESFVV